MCGIVSYFGKKDAVPILIDGLKRLEYRGYDSAGIALMHDGAIKSMKKAGKVSELNNKINALLAELVSSLDQKQRKNYRQRINFFIKSLDRIIDNYI